MKRNYKVLTVMVLCATIFCGCTFGNAKSFDNPDKDKTLIELITYVIDQLHFNPGDIDDQFSENVYMNYIQGLDPYKRYFRKSDIEEFSEYKYLIDDQLKKSEITFFKLTHGRLVQRIEEAKELYPKVLNKSFDFTKDETYFSDTEKLSYAKNKRELIERWRKQLKFSAINVFDSEKKTDEAKLKEDNKYKVRSDKELEKEARNSVSKSIADNFDNLDDLEREDWFAVYLNAVVLEFDPHTFYFSPEDKDRFDTSMSGKLEGIGARLQKRNGNINIIEVVSGGPAWKGEEVESGDVILKVRQMDEELPVDVVGMKLDDAVKLIKGPKGTQVELTLKKKIDGSIQDVLITRDVVELEEAYAKTSLVEKGNRKYGVINLPKFYIDFKDYGERNAATDVAKEIERLKKQGMDGLVLDLRGNGGGSLKTVVDMAGLFIKKGPIVQVKSTGERKEVLKDEDARIQWDGPLVILVNELSASASEILAAAMQDYKRAVIIGSKQTYGKGTVQNVIDLNRLLRSNSYGDVGAMKITTQKFYRVNGGSTQLEGVKSDVVVPDRYTYINVGEKDQDNPLPWDKIDAATYRPWNDYIDFERVVGSSKERMAASNHFKLIDEQAKWISEQREDSSFPLNYDQYLEEAKQNTEFTKRFEALSEYTNNLTFNSLPYEIEAMKIDSVLADKRERWHKSLSRDAYIEEAVNVLEDLKIDYLNRKNRKLADINKG